jgi:NadR type nicotinamide-nucleotide adenylyltransferase
MGLLRIALLGPESSGKSGLAEALAEHFKTAWVPEYARTFLSERPGNYTREDVLYCAAGQRALEDAKATEADRYLFCDTDMINFKIWLTDKFGSAPTWITDDLASRYDAYLLTSPDLPFVKDPLRENESRREHFFEVYRREITAAGIPFEIISGKGDERIHAAVAAVEKLTGVITVKH